MSSSFSGVINYKGALVEWSSQDGCDFKLDAKGLRLGVMDRVLLLGIAQGDYASAASIVKHGYAANTAKA
jgi:hypothetical protein